MDISRESLEPSNGALDVRLVHQSLLGLVSKLTALTDQSDASVLPEALAAFRELAVAQFRREESLMDTVGYGAATPHRGDHDRFLAEVEARIALLSRDKTNAGSAIAPLLSRLLEHVTREDIIFVLSFVPDGERTGGNGEPDEDTDYPVSFDEILVNLNEPMRWSASHATEIAPIDENHQIIFSRIREIVDARDSASKERLGQMLAQLGDETAEHFDSEERVMSEHHYEFAAVHREEHRKLLEEFACQVDDFRNDVISVELMCRFVYGWFVRHIQDSDIPLSNALRRQMR